MGRRPDVDFESGTVTATRKLRSSGGSTVLTIPPEILDAMRLDPGDDVVIVAHYEDGEMHIRPAPDEATDE